MEVKDFNELPSAFLADSAATVGNFDGAHVGHRAIIGRVIERARQAEVPSAVITFNPHPREVVYKGLMVPAIIPFSERVRLIGEMGVDYLFTVQFTPQFAQITAGEFVADLFAKLRPRLVVIGHDFRFGKGREGDYPFLLARGKQAGFEVESVPAVEIDGKPVSSTRIRAMIQAGEMGRARKLLGAPFNIQGEVVRGHGRGKGLGFATANLRWENKLIPPDGVYAAIACWNGNRCPAVINIGTNPTFDNGDLSVEAHVMGFEGDLYGHPVRLEIYKRLRGEIKFDGKDALVAQIEEDVRRAREELLAATGEDLFDKPLRTSA